MRIAVGLVYQGAPARPSLREEPGLDVVVRVNAGHGGGGTPWLGFGANHNRLMADIGGADWYVALNPDVRLAGDDIKRLVEAGEAGGYDVIAPLLRSPWGVGGTPQRALPGPGQWLREAARGARRSGAGQSDGAVMPSAWVSGACIALRTGSDQTRFDEGYFMYFEDASLCYRVRRTGGQVGVCQDVVVSHESGWSSYDPLRWRRGVEFARSALRFAAETHRSVAMMRLAGVIRFGSRVLPRGRFDSERVAARVIGRGFVRVGTAPGLAELAAEHNAGLRD